jgi:oligoribonuclease NrnB/cAMP/cGMP phosphodiesterase (DHH superfamily)
VAYNRIITHSDFDGVVSTVICSHVFGINRYFFTGPRVIQESKIRITKNDIVCDLPCPPECGLWFDHHEGNAKDVKAKGIDTEKIEGCFALKPSCSRVIFDYFRPSHEMPSWFVLMVDEADEIDAFNYTSIEEWQKETPGKIIDWTIKLREGDNLLRRDYMKQLVSRLKTASLDDVARMPFVLALYQKYKDEKQSILERIQKEATFLEADKNKELVVLDMTKHQIRPKMLKHLSYLLFPQSLGVIEINTLYEEEIKTNNLSISMSLSLKKGGGSGQKNVGEIMREMHIGDGHRGAGAGVVFCGGESEMERMKEKILKQIYSIWRNQSNECVSELRI